MSGTEDLHRDGTVRRLKIFSSQNDVNTGFVVSENVISTNSAREPLDWLLKRVSHPSSLIIQLEA